MAADNPLGGYFLLYFLLNRPTVSGQMTGCMGYSGPGSLSFFHVDEPL